MTKVAWQLNKDKIQNSHPTETKAKFIYNVSRSEYRKDWGDVYEKPGFVPSSKVGPLSSLAFHPPTPAVEQLYMASFNATLDHYRVFLLAERVHRLQLPNENLDIGVPTVPATYRLTDETYAELLNKTNGKHVSDSLRKDLLSYYADLDRPFVTKRKSKAWRELVQELDILKSADRRPK
jgi:hypothetical protein